jgi:hypothetical protein
LTPEETIMKITVSLASTALLAAGLALTAASFARAQDQDAGLEQHHPAGPNAAQPPGPGGMMGTMSPEMMTHMQEMMRSGMPMGQGMMGGMGGRGAMMQPAPTVTIIINTQGMPAMHGPMMGGAAGQSMMMGGQMGPGMMGRGMMMGQPGMAAQGPAAMAYRQAMMRMHQGMGVALTGDADIDFARAMIPHHEGAITMAKVALEHGKDPEIRRIAQGVIDAQGKEIATLQAWLAKHPEP